MLRSSATIKVSSASPVAYRIRRFYLFSHSGRVQCREEKSVKRINALQPIIPDSLLVQDPVFFALGYNQVNSPPHDQFYTQGSARLRPKRSRRPRRQTERARI